MLSTAPQDPSDRPPPSLQTLPSELKDEILSHFFEPKTPFHPTGIMERGYAIALTNRQLFEDCQVFFSQKKAWTVTFASFAELSHYVGTACLPWTDYCGPMSENITKVVVEVDISPDEKTGWPKSVRADVAAATGELKVFPNLKELTLILGHSAGGLFAAAPWTTGLCKFTWPPFLEKLDVQAPDLVRQVQGDGTPTVRTRREHFQYMARSVELMTLEAAVARANMGLDIERIERSMGRVQGSWDRFGESLRTA